MKKKKHHEKRRVADESTTTPAQELPPRPSGRTYLRTVRASKMRVQVGEPVHVSAKLKRAAPADAVVRIGGALGTQRYMTFATPGLHRVPVSVSHRQGAIDRAELEVEVIESSASHPYPRLRVRQDPTNPFLLHCSLGNAEAVHRRGARYEWRIEGYGWFFVREPYFVVDCERLLDTTTLDIPFDIELTVTYPDGERRTTIESFRVWNDYVWFKSRGVMKPRSSYDHQVRAGGPMLVASCELINPEDEPLRLTSRQFEVLYDDRDRVMVPEPPEPFATHVEPRSSTTIDCGIPRTRLPHDAFGYALHFHGNTPSGLKVEASVYFEYRTNAMWWASVVDSRAVELLETVKAALVPRHEGASSLAAPQRLSVANVRAYVDAMAPTWTAIEHERHAAGLEMIMKGVRGGVDQRLRGGDSDEFFLGTKCLQDEDPPSDNLVCQLSGRRGKVYIPARIMNGKKGDVVLVPGGPLGFIGGLLQQVDPPQRFSHCGIMTSNFYQLRHATASGDWLEDEVYGRTVLDPDAVGTEGFSPESVKFIWPGTVTQEVDEAFSGSFLPYVSADGKRQKAYEIKAFSRDPVFFDAVEDDRHIVFPLVVKPDPLLEGDPAFARLRPTLLKVAENAKRIAGHYRFFCYSNGAISFRDDTRFRAPTRASWWASDTRPMVCSTLVLAAIEDLNGEEGQPKVRVEGRGIFVSEGDLERSAAPQPDRDAAVDSLTRDGLYVYDEQERKKAAGWLYDRVYAKAYEKAKFLGRLFTDAPSDFANQVVNTFAFDYSDREFDDEDAKDSDKWTEPGIGRTVSPDDILRFWDRPAEASADMMLGLYGTAQRMVYRESVFEERELGVWVKRERMGKLVVQVMRHGRPVPGADVKVGGRVQVTSPSGETTVELPEGSYEVEAGVFMDDLFFEGRAKAAVRDRGETKLTVQLDDPIDMFRVVVIGGRVDIKDEETFGKDEYLHEAVGLPPFYLGPTHKQESFTWVKKFGGEIRVEARFDLSWRPDLSVAVALNVKLFEGTSEDTNDLDGERGTVIVVMRDQQNVPLEIKVRNDAEDDDDWVHLNLLVGNVIDIR